MIRSNFKQDKACSFFFALYARITYYERICFDIVHLVCAEFNSDVYAVPDDYEVLNY
jgi:hypothetical protein